MAGSSQRPTESSNLPSSRCMGIFCIETTSIWSSSITSGRHMLSRRSNHSFYYFHLFTTFLCSIFIILLFTLFYFDMLWRLIKSHGFRIFLFGVFCSFISFPIFLFLRLSSDETSFSRNPKPSSSTFHDGMLWTCMIELTGKKKNIYTFMTGSLHFFHFSN